jgi:hypothetical protein
MQVLALAVEGARHGPTLSVDHLDTVGVLPAPPAGTLLADGLMLWVAAFDPERAAAVLQDLGLAAESLEVSAARGLSDEASPLLPTAVDALCAPGPTRSLRISATLQIDPPIFHLLRSHAARDPQLATALTSSSQIEAKVGWLFNRDGTAASIALLSFKVGALALPLDAKERPAWLPELCKLLAGRVHRLGWHEPEPTLANAYLDAATAPQPELRRRYEVAAAALAAAPFSLGRLALVRHAGAPSLAFGDDLVPARLLGPHAALALRLVHGAKLLNPDVLLVELPSLPPPLRGWLEQCTSGAQPSQEQILWVTPQ